MCGIAGLWHLKGAPRAQLDAHCRAMTDAIAYRGPDGDGRWVDPEVGIALGHRRLAIIDLTPTGVQPMTSADGRIVISYNGELYNTPAMAAELAMQFRGTSDTEVLVEAIARFGIDGALARANGLFAFAAFDRATRTLHLARDHIGIKPLYWTRQNGIFAFASELKALRAVPGLRFEIDPELVAAYLRHACVPAPRSIYKNVWKLRAGERLEAQADADSLALYWNLPAIAQEGQRHLDQRNESDITDELDGLLADVVKSQMVSDVPLGAFLSGGIDSSIVVALMQRASSRAVKTFSIGFREEAYNEADAARAVAQHIGTDHTEVILSGDDTLALLPRMPTIYDEPFSDSWQIPTFLVSQLARRDVTVALSGDGGDEGFGGYVRYQGVSRLWGALRPVPKFLRHAAAGAITMLAPATWDALASPIPARRKPAHFGDKVHKGAALLPVDGPVEMYRRLISQWPDPDTLVRGAREPAGWADHVGAKADLDPIGKLRLLDMLNYLPDDILTKVDRASMAVSLEVRVPLLDQRVLQFAWRLPSTRLIAHGRGKLPLRAVLARYVPPALTERPKIGFGVPIGQWLRGPLRDWAHDLLSPAALMADGLFDPAPVQRRLAEHMSGRRNWQYALWAVLQFQAWRRANH